MNMVAPLFKRIFSLLLVALMCTSCGSGAISEKSFVGKWKSTKLETPTYLYGNGEWEIKTEAGAVLQYGVWEYEGNKITWSYMTNSRVERDVNPVLSVTQKEFQVRENDGTTTTFSRLDQN